MVAGTLQLDQTLSTAVCAHICSSVTLGELSRFNTVAESAIQGLADVLAAYIVEVGSSAQAQAEFAGRAESNLVDVMLVLQSRAEGEPAPWAELLQLMHTPVQRLPANLLSGGPLSSADVRAAAPSSGASSPPQRTTLPAPLTSDGREYREAVGFLPALPARHTFVAPEPPTLSVDPESRVNEHSAQRRRTAARRQIELNLCKLRAAAVAQDRPPGNSDAPQGADEGKDPESGIKTVVGLGAALQLSAMNERAGRYAREASAGGLWAQNGLSPQTFLNNQALLAGARSVRAPKRKREEAVATQQPLQLEDAVQTQYSDKAESADKVPESSDARPSPLKQALVLGNSGGAVAAGAASAPASAPPVSAPNAAVEESDDDDKPLAPPKRLALTIGNKSRPSLTIKSNRAAALAPAPAANSAECSVQPSASATAAALPSASPASSALEQLPVVGIGSGGDISMSHPKLMGQCLKMLEEIKAYASSWPFLAPVPEDTPGYNLYVKEPIDISTIEARLNARQYGSLAAFEAAFKLMYDNCDAYNDPTINPTGGVYLECSIKSRAKAEKRFGKIKKKLLEGGKKSEGAETKPKLQLKLSMK